MQATTDASAALTGPPVSPGQLIRTARQRAGLSQEKLAREADVSTSTVIRLERASQLPNAPALGRIAHRLGVSVDDLVRAQAPVVAGTSP